MDFNTILPIAVIAVIGLPFFIGFIAVMAGVISKLFGKRGS